MGKAIIKLLVLFSFLTSYGVGNDDNAGKMQRIRIGTIRWDAWLPSTSSIVGAAVAKALNPVKYRLRSPFFSILNQGKIDFPEYTLDIWEQEVDYAVYAGIDYWAYCWYTDNSPMSLARKYHTQSPKNKEIQMCAILGVASFTEIERNQLFAAMKEDYYVKVNGMPLVYIYGGSKNMDNDTIVKLRSEAAKTGLPALYVVSMVSAGMAEGETVLSKGYDALSFYSYPVANGPLTYAQLAAKAEKRNIDLGTKLYLGKPVPMIPSFTAGRDVRPRLDNPVPWGGDYGSKNYAELGTASEIAGHMSNVLEWTLSHPGNAAAQCVISYAWNEHDEGGWICPAIKMNEDSNLLIVNGKMVPDSSIINAIRDAIIAFRIQEDKK